MLSTVDAGLMEATGSSVVVAGSTVDSSTVGAGGPIKACSTEIGSVLGMGSSAGGSDSSPDFSSGASPTSVVLRLPSCLIRFCSDFFALSSSFLAFASRFSSSTQCQCMVQAGGREKLSPLKRFHSSLVI